MRSTLPNAPITSDRWYPNDTLFEAWIVLIFIEISEIKIPEKSQRMCAASVRMASDPERSPPTNSIPIKAKQSRDTTVSLQMAFCLSFLAF